MFTKKSNLKHRIYIKTVYNMRDLKEGDKYMESINMKKSIVVLIAICIACSVLTSCSKKNKNNLSNDPSNSVNNEIENAKDSIVPNEMPSVDFNVTAKEGKNAPSAYNAKIILDNNNTSIEGDGADFADGRLTIANEGTYVLSGHLDNGQIYVNTSDTEKVKLILNGVAVNCTYGPAIFVESAPKKVILYSTEESVNVLIDGENYIVPDEEQTEGNIYPNACVYSVEDLKFDGAGEIYVTSKCGKGVNSKDDIEVCGGNLYVASADDGMRGNDSFEMSGGYIHIKCESDGIKSSNSDTEGKGYINISGGQIYIECGLDGIDAATHLSVTGGLITLKCAGGAKEAITSDMGGMGNGGGYMGSRPGFPGGPMGGGMMNEGNSQAPEYSCKGLKAASALTISGGTITADTPDDAIHSNDKVIISGGDMSLNAGDDGIHADNNVNISNSNISITQSYEGIEAINIIVDSGTVRIIASDDGLNAYGGDSMAGGGMRPREIADNTETEPLLTINGGYIIVNAQGDGVDSNGNIVMNGGFCIVFGPTNGGNGAVDFGDGNYDMTVSGGTFLAVGAAGMAETVTGIGQGVVAFNCGSVNANSLMTLCDGNENVLISFASPKNYQTVVFSSSNVVKGDEYTVYHGGENSGNCIDGIYIGGNITNAQKLGSLDAA